MKKNIRRYVVFSVFFFFFFFFNILFKQHINIYDIYIEKILAVLFVIVFDFCLEEQIDGSLELCKIYFKKPQNPKGAPFDVKEGN